MIVIADVVQLWMVYVLILCFGVAQSFDNPTRMAFVSEMVDRDDVANAVGLNSTLFQLARIVGPAFAGVLIVTIGTGPCFVVNAAVVRRGDRGAARDGRRSALHRAPLVAKDEGSDPRRVPLHLATRRSCDHCSASRRSSARWRSTSPWCCR